MSIQTVKIKDLTFSFIDEAEFDYLYDEMFCKKSYKFITKTTSPLIIDCGAHIGMSVLFFKKLYPDAKIIAFEPSPDTFRVLELNIRQNNLRNVELVNAAISDTPGEIDFYVSKGGSHTGDSVIKSPGYNAEEFESIKVPAVRLSSYITGNVDLLKLDIEGMEEIVLKEIETKLQFIKEIRMEFHGNLAESNNIERILSILKRNKFKYTSKSHSLDRILSIFSRIKNVYAPKQKIIQKTADNDFWASIIYAHRKLIYLYWQCWVLSVLDRIQLKLLKMLSHPVVYNPNSDRDF